jgi:transcriptional regulator with XRE-family HTH domain
MYEYTERLKQKKLKLSLKDRQDINLINRNISKMIKIARIEKGYTQEDLAKMLQTKQPSIARLESGKGTPTITFLNEVAKALETYLIEPRFKSVEHFYITEYAQIKEMSENTMTHYNQIEATSKNKDYSQPSLLNFKFLTN